jgi:hypothetical protein
MHWPFFNPSLLGGGEPMNHSSIDQQFVDGGRSLPALSVLLVDAWALAND